MTRRLAWLCEPNETPIALEEVPFVDTERLLEDWVEQDPSILGDGYVVVGRQVNFEGGPADLVVIDPQGRWVIVEIKRARNHRQDVSQALDYASSLRKEPADQLRARLTKSLLGKPYREEALDRLATALADDADGPRDVALLLLGVGVQPGAERIREFLSDHGIDARIVSLGAHRDLEGRFVLWRDEDDVAVVASPYEARSSEEAMESIRNHARDFGVLEQFDRWLDACQGAGLNARAYKHSVMITPPQHSNTYLMVGRPLKGGALRLNHGTARFPEWFPWISEDEAESILGVSERGPGKARTGVELDEYLTQIELFLDSFFPPPPGYSMTESPARWTKDSFENALSGNTLEQRRVSIAIENAEHSGRIDYGAGAVGQAHLAFTPNGPQILQVSTGGRVRGMWSLGNMDKNSTCWAQLKKFFEPLGGHTSSGSAPSIPIQNFTDAQWQELLQVSRITAACFDPQSDS
jgi:hypothetical protein